MKVSYRYVHNSGKCLKDTARANLVCIYVKNLYIITGYT